MLLYMHSIMTILGVDPGYARVGWGVVNETSGKITANAHGLITTQKEIAPETRLSEIYTAFGKILDEYTPDAVAVEDLFFSNNAKTAIAVGQARGVILLCANQHYMPVFSYSPVAIKKAICGSGSADKSQVGKMMVQLLRLKKLPTPDDVADALAIAATHGYSYKLKRKLV